MSYQHLTDQALVTLLTRSDEKAFEEIYLRHWQGVFRFALGKISTQEIVEDICHEINGFPVTEVTVDKKGTVINKTSPGLPQNWVGGKAFDIKSEKDQTGQNIILVPYADASQTGGAISTWLITANN